ncbi:MAG: UDPglucose 6-dehydrogenase [Pyrococcus sp.]|uniref:UDP-glucose dehydrogenase family protein n=1 Tax=Pyrococcus sp. TaxID=33866 RepID=UPI00258C016B|nr:UDP-glucose/GDP-mannose dehydrogenase family protein [Pyrococcus sp.]MDK2870575.1 UDPglucose 6-dehydrogenase [Pyrococcus sp.]
MNVSVFGLGYVGLTYAVCLAYRGFKVIGVDVDEERVKTINKGIAPFFEPNLDSLLKQVISDGSFIATTDYKYAVENSDVSVIFVGTPSLPDGSPDLKYVKSASEMIGEALRFKEKYHLVVVRSTVPPGTTEEVVKPIIENISGKVCGKDFGLCMNPEFVREGRAVEDTLKPDRVVIGEFDERSGEFLENLYKKFLGDWKCPIIRTSTYNAELIKYAANTFLALKISYINFIARLCEKLPKADVRDVADGIGLDPRIGRAFLNAGLGFGGSCFPKDLKAFIKIAEALGEEPSLINSVIRINEEQIERAVWLLKKGLGKDITNAKIAVLGLSFKPNTDDIRESQSIKLVKRLVELGAQVKVHDPKALEKAKSVLGNTVEYCNDMYECLKDSEAILIATEWPEYSNIDLDLARKVVRNPLIIDCRRILDPKIARNKGFKYLGMGRSLLML